MSWMDDIFGGGSYSNPADAAQPYLDKIPEYVEQYYQPYIDTGLEAGGIAQSQYAKMASDPMGYYDEIYAGYEPSDYYQYQSDNLSDAATSTAAAGGFAGTEYDQQKQMETQNALLNKDWQQYLANVLGIQGSGLQGEQQMYGTGYQASKQSADDMIGYAGESAGMQYAGASGENQYNNAMNNAMLSALGQAGGIALMKLF